MKGKELYLKITFENAIVAYFNERPCFSLLLCSLQFFRHHWFLLLKVFFFLIGHSEISTSLQPSGYFVSRNV
jgi:hypothetical protein